MFKRMRDYAKDYKIVDVAGGSGFAEKKRAEYHGKYYRIYLSVAVVRKKKIQYALLIAASVALYVAAGLTGSSAFGGRGASAAFYVLLPYVFMLLPLGVACGNAVMLLLSREPFQYAEYDKYLMRQRGVLAAAFLVSCVFALGQLVFLLFGTYKNLLREELLLVLTLLLFTCALLLLRLHRGLVRAVSADGEGPCLE